MNTVIHLRFAKIQINRFWNIIGGAIQLNGVANHVQHAAHFQARAGFFVEEVHAHFHRNFRVFTKAQKISVQNIVAHGVQLHIASNGALPFTVHFNFEKRAKQTTRVEDFGNISDGYRNTFWSFFAPINNGRH